MADVEGEASPYKFYLWDNAETRLTEDHLWVFWNMMPWQHVFYDGQVRSAPDFVAFCRSGYSRLWAIYMAEQPLGLVWLNGFTGRAAYIHLTSFKGAHRRHTVPAAREFIRRVFNSPDPLDKSRPFLETLVGITPASYSLALAYAARCGFVEKCRIPLALHLAHEGRFDDAVVTCLTRA